MIISSEITFGAVEMPPMFIHFDRDQSEKCDNCGELDTIMHMSVERLDATLNLCVICFGALTRAFENASAKLRIERFEYPGP